MKYGILGTVAAAALLISGSANALIIDDFSDTQTVTPASAGVLETDTIAAGVIGGERTITIFNATGTDTTIDVNSATAGELSVSHGTTPATTQLIYDGVGTGGFAPVNFEAGGDDTIRLLVTSFQAGAPTGIDIEVFSAGGSSIVSDPGATATGALDFLYSSFTTNTGSGADFTAVTGITFTFTAPFGFEDSSYDLLETANTVPDVVISEPASLAVLGLGLLGMAGYRRRTANRV